MRWDSSAAKQFGLVLRQLREEHGLSQETLAFRAGITKNQVQLIESGKGSGRKEAMTPSNPRLSTLIGIASVLEISVHELLERSGI
ncbi:helix-turn-helix domain-containing protein [Psychromicrobium sp. YIM B11713]|uniref:helix-turn-helix domain-containing protein n=1 Tax=Psychromicrobium sp. YIM B11713 TaxID=3145233 RepID=UPI00374F8D5C